jgi:methionyl aminopeptidase
MAEAIKIHSETDFIKMRAVGKLCAEVLDYIEEFVHPGITTERLDELCSLMIKERGAISATLNYHGFPKSICTSVNHVVCHGIPGKEMLQEGDIINIDVTVIYEGHYGDSSRMFFVGNNISPKAKHVVQVAYDCMMLGINEVRPGAPLNSIGRAIEQHAIKNGCSVVRDFCGHGIGTQFHAEPQILHFYDSGFNTIMEPGMFFTVEPMINIGKYQTKILGDGWTAITKDKSLSAQFEHTIAVTKTGYEIFTISPKHGLNSGLSR